MPLLFKMFDLPALNEHRARIFEVFDQSYNVPLNDPTKPIYATKRDLMKVLEHYKCKEFGFGLHNSMMIDSDLSKVQDYPKNAIVIKDYEESEVRKPTEDQSKILLEVRDYVYNMLEECNDVRTYLTNNRPTFQVWEHGILSKKSSNDAEESKQSLEETSSIADTPPVTKKAESQSK